MDATQCAALGFNSELVLCSDCDLLDETVHDAGELTLSGRARLTTNSNPAAAAATAVVHSAHTHAPHLLTRAYG